MEAPGLGRRVSLDGKPDVGAAVAALPSELVVVSEGPAAGSPDGDANHVYVLTTKVLASEALASEMFFSNTSSRAWEAG